MSQTPPVLTCPPDGVPQGTRAGALPIPQTGHPAWEAGIPAPTLHGFASPVQASPAP